MSRTTWISALFALACVLPAAVATAQDASHHNQRGAEAYRQGRFEEAAKSFRAAWKLSENPITRKNEAIAWFKGERCDQAVVAASSFVSYGVATYQDFKEANSVIANCKAAMAHGAMDAHDYGLAYTLVEESRYLDVDPYAREQVNLARLRLARSSADGGGASDRVKLGRALTGGGIAMTVGAIVYHIAIMTSTVQRLEDVADAGEDEAVHDRLSRRVAVSRWLVPTMYSLGLVGTGLGVYFLVTPGGTSDGTVTTAQVGIGGAL